MFKISNFTDNDDVTVLKEFGAFKTIEWKRDLSVNEASAMNAYFASEMNVRRRQVICDLSQAPVTVQAGAMQWMVGNVTCTTGVKGVGDLFGKALRGAVTSESAIKPEYQGTGLLVLEPTYRYIITLDVADWGQFHRARRRPIPGVLFQPSAQNGYAQQRFFSRCWQRRAVQPGHPGLRRAMLGIPLPRRRAY